MSHRGFLLPSPGNGRFILSMTNVEYQMERAEDDPNGCTTVTLHSHKLEHGCLPVATHGEDA